MKCIIITGKYMVHFASKQLWLVMTVTLASPHALICWACESPARNGTARGNPALFQPSSSPTTFPTLAPTIENLSSQKRWKAIKISLFLLNGNLVGNKGLTVGPAIRNCFNRGSWIPNHIWLLFIWKTLTIDFFFPAINFRTWKANRSYTDLALISTVTN